MKRYAIAFLSLGFIGSLGAMTPPATITQLQTNFVGSITIVAFPILLQMGVPGPAWQFFGLSAPSSRPLTHKVNIVLGATATTKPSYANVFACAHGTQNCVYTYITADQVTSSNAVLFVDQTGRATIRSAQQTQ